MKTLLHILIKTVIALLVIGIGGFLLLSYVPDNSKPFVRSAKEQALEQLEDQLSRTDRLYRLFYFKEAVEQTLQKRLSADKVLTIQDISPIMKQAIVATEDKRFYEHGAVDFLSIARATYSNLQAGETQEGASTITQQLVKNLFLSSKRTFTRKTEEIILAHLMEQYYSKDEILSMYLSTIYFGNSYDGLFEAAKGYFQVAPSQLNLPQAAMLAGIPQAPTYYNPVEHYKAAKERQKTVLRLLEEQRIISPKEATKAYYTDLKLNRP